VPSVIFHVVESTYNPLTVTAEVASSNVVPSYSFFVTRVTFFGHFRGPQERLGGIAEMDGTAETWP
jgi:hypothetical protein